MGRPWTPLSMYEWSQNQKKGSDIENILSLSLSSILLSSSSVGVAICANQPDLNWSQLMRDSLGQAELGLK